MCMWMDGYNTLGAEDKWWEGSVKRFGPSVWSSLGFALSLARAVCVYFVFYFSSFPFSFKVR